jgi:phage recombination protein Bet
MNDIVQAKDVPQTSLQVMASRLSVDPVEMEEIVMKTLISAKGNGQVSTAEFVTYMAIANEYQLNPLTKEIYAFANRGVIQPIVSIDGWLKIINSNPQFDGMEFDDISADGGALSAVTCRIYRKDRSRPVSVTEYMTECAGTSEPWKRWPARMLRHKATIQAARYAFGLSGIVDPDEADRIKSVDQQRPVERDITPGRENPHQDLDTLLSDRGADPASFLPWMSKLLDREITIIADLSDDEANDIIKRMENAS